MSNEPLAQQDTHPGYTTPLKRPWHRGWVLLPILLLILGLDQLTKYVVRANLYLGESLPREGFLRLTYNTNTGGAFGLFPNQTLLLILASFVGIGLIYLFYRSHALRSTPLRISLGLQLGGATGNLIDRIRSGSVVDFIDVGPWPIFNLADASIVVGILLLMTLVLFSTEKQKSAGEPAEEGNSETGEQTPQ